MEISTDGGKTYRRPTYFETVNLYITDLCNCDGSSDGGNIDTSKLKEEIKKEIINDDSFKAEIAKLVDVSGGGGSVDTSVIEENVKKAIESDDNFVAIIAAKAAYDDTNIKKELSNKVDSATLTETLKSYAKSEDVNQWIINKITEVVAGAPEKFDTLKEIADWIENDTTNATKITNDIADLKVKNESIKKELGSTVKTADLDSVKSDISDSIKSDTAFKAEIAKSVDTSTIKTEVESNIKEDTEFKNTVAGLVTVDTNSIKSGVETDLKADEEFKNSLKGEKGEDGKSIKSLDKDENNNIIVTFSDNTTQNIGKLNIDISADFLTDNGFGNIRFSNSKFQYYDSASSTWVNINITDTNKFIVNLVPQNMKSIYLDLDKLSKSIKLKFTEPNDTIIDGQLLCYIAGIKIVRKLGSEPESETDGDLILDLKRSDFGKYKSNYYIDNNINFTIGNKYYYKFFPYANTGMINNSNVNCTFIEIKEYSLFGFKIDQTESDPDNMITYIAQNANYKSAKMDFETGIFDYGDWANAWFIKDLKPCMLKYDGTVDYYLNPNDYTKKENGENSDITNSSYAGNAMIEFPKVYYKIIDNNDNTADVYFSDKKLDDNYHCWSHIDNNGNEIDYCYISIFNGSLDSNNRLRSLSGLSPMVNRTAQDEITFAKTNNINSDSIWYTEIYSDRLLINLLLLLIGKSTNTQSIFGTGLEENNPILQTGSMNDKGLFFGSSLSSQGVKVFGIENYWGNIWRRTAGYIYINNIQKVKMTYGKQDGSTCIGYNTDGEGYIEIENSNFEGTNSSYIKSMIFNSFGMFAKNLSGSSSTYYTDVAVFNSNPGIAYYSLFGGTYNKSNYYNGALTCALSDPASLSGENSGCSLSCKPLLKEGN